MSTKMTAKRTTWTTALVSALVLAGCGPDAVLDTTTASAQAVPPSGAPAAPAAAPAGYQPTIKVGVPVNRSADPTLISSLSESRSFGSRSNAFALLPQERSFDMSQRAERFAETIGWSQMFEEPEEVAMPDDTPEPQPYRRLAGILVGDTVSAILIMENGEAHIVKPGTRIPNSPWRVVSIDQDKAILRRAGTRKPTQIVVALETPPGGVPNPAGQGPGVGAGGGPPGSDEGLGGPPRGRGGRGGPPGAVGGADR